MTLHQLRIFWAVAHAATLTQAAKQLGLTQPSLSQQLSKLEESVGAKLFDRSGNQMTLTDASIIAAATEQGLDKDKFATAMTSGDTTVVIAEDARAAQQLGLTSIPMVFVNGKYVPRPVRDGESVLGRIFDEAGKTAAAGGAGSGGGAGGNGK